MTPGQQAVTYTSGKCSDPGELLSVVRCELHRVWEMPILRVFLMGNPDQWRWQWRLPPTTPFCPWMDSEGHLPSGSNLK